MPVLLTIHYHVRSAAEVSRRYGKRLEVTVYGHESVGALLDPGVPFEAIVPGASPARRGVRPSPSAVLGAGRCRCSFPARRALAFGDAVVGVDGELRVWEQVDGRDDAASGTRTASCPRFGPLAELDFDHVARDPRAARGW